MAEEQAPPSGPDLAQGIATSDFEGKTLLGHVGDQDVLLVRTETEIFAIDAQCSHYHGPLAEGLVVGHSVRCPWHHACFDLRTGEATRAPALSSLSVWKVEQQGDRIFVREKQDQPQPLVKGPVVAPDRIVIVGGGAAGFAASEMLRREKFGGDIVMLSDDGAAPVDRPNLSKDYLTGSAPEDWLPLRPDDFYAKAGIDLRLKTQVAAIDPKTRQVALSDGKTVSYDRLLLATGAEPVHLPIPGADQPHVHLLRSLADCQAIIASTKGAKRAVVIGGSFIGLEVAASLRAREIEVHVVAPEQRPMQRVLGPEMGDFVRALHEQHGVIFHLGDTVAAIDGRRVILKSGGTLEADLVVIGVGVRPRLALAERAGLSIDRGVTVNQFLETSIPGIFAAGDIARWPDRHSQKNIRVEHWVVAERQGARPPPATCWGSKSRSMPCRSSGAALRCADQLCRSRRSMGRDRYRGRYRRQRLPAALQERRPRVGGRFDLPRYHKPADRAGDGAGHDALTPIGDIAPARPGTSLSCAG